MTRIFRGAIKKLPGHILCRFMPERPSTMYIHAHVHVKRSRHESSHWLSGPDGQTPGVHPVTRIFLSHGPAAVTRFLSGQSLLISPCSFIIQSPVATKQYVSAVLFFPSFLSLLFFLPLQFYPYPLLEQENILVSRTNPTS